MPSVQSKLFAVYPKEQIPCVTLRTSTFAKAKEASVIMKDFHDGQATEFTTLKLGKLTIVHTPLHAQKMMAYIYVPNELCVLAFSRKGPTNFAHAPVELAPGLSVHCNEQFFQLLKACYVGEEASSNFEECVLGMFASATPFKTKSHGNSVLGFNDEKWQAENMSRMDSAIKHACMIEATFLRYKAFVSSAPDAEIAALVKAGRFVVLELNDDLMWGAVKSYTMELYKALEAKFALMGEKAFNETFDLEAFIKEYTVGQNKLGRVLTDFLLAIHDMEHADYVAAMNGVEFFKVTDKRQSPDSRTASVEEEEEEEKVEYNGRTLSCF